MSAGRTQSTTGAPVIAGSQVGYARTTSTTTASTTSTTIPTDNTIPQNTEGVAYASLDTTITPRFSNSKLEVEVHIPLYSHSAAGNALRLAVFRDSGVDAVHAEFSNQHISANSFGTISFKFVVDAGSTAATTFKLRWGVASGTGYLMTISGTSYFSSALVACMTVKEIAQ